MGEVLEEQLTASSPAEIPEASMSLEYEVCAMRGYLYKKERFTWNKMDCLIRNSFLECRKPNSTQGPALKLFLPRSVVTPDREARRQWAIRVKHPRREGVLQFAAENEDEYKKWMRAFSSAAAIEVCMYSVRSRMFFFLSFCFILQIHDSVLFNFGDYVASAEQKLC